MKFSWLSQSVKTVFQAQPEILVTPKIFFLNELTATAPVPEPVREWAGMVTTHPEFTTQALVVPAQFVADFWLHQDLGKKIKKITSTINLRHPRSMSHAAEQINRLISKQTIPAAWEKEWHKTTKALSKQAKHGLTTTLFLAEPTMGSVDWLPELQVSSADQILKLLRKSLAALYSERCLREREQRGWGHTQITATLVFSARLTATTYRVQLTTHEHGVLTSPVAALQLESNTQREHYTLFKPALISKKSLILNRWKRTLVSEKLVATWLEPLVLLAKKHQRAVIVTGQWDASTNQLTINRLDWQASPEISQAVEYVLQKRSAVLVQGNMIGQGIAIGPLALIRTKTIEPQSGSILVAKHFADIPTDYLKSAVGIILEDSLETVVPQIKHLPANCVLIAGVRQALRHLRTGTMVTVARENDLGVVYAGALPYEVKPAVTEKKKIKTQVRLPQSIIAVDELIAAIGNQHPLQYFKNKNTSEYSELLGQALAETVAKQYPHITTVALSSSLPAVFTAWQGGLKAERQLKLRTTARGAERYLLPAYTPVLAAECAALKQTKERFGFNFTIQLPYCRSVSELEQLLSVLAKEGIDRANGWRFVLATDVPGHALLTQALSQHLDELMFDLDSLVKSTTGERGTVLTPARQKTIETALSAIVKAAHKEKTRVILTGSLLAREPKLVLAAIKSGINGLLIDAPEETQVRAAAWSAERALGNVHFTNRPSLTAVAGLAVICVLFITAGAGCGLVMPRVESPQLTPAQIRLEIMNALAEKNAATEIRSKVSGFADFSVAHPQNWQATFSPKNLTLVNQDTKETLVFSVLSRFGSTSSTEFVTKTNLTGKLFSYTTDPEPLHIYEIELPDKKILKIESPTSSPEIMAIAQSVE